MRRNQIIGPVVVWHRVYEDGHRVPGGNVLRLHGSRVYLPLLPILRADPAGIERNGNRTRGGSGSGRAGRDHGCCFGACDVLDGGSAWARPSTGDIVARSHASLR